MIKKTTRFSYFLLVLLCMVYNVARAQDNSSSGSPIILNSSQCNAYFSSASNVIDVTWWYNDPSTTPIDGSYQQITTSTMPYSGVNFSVSDPTRIDFYFSESYAPLRGKLIRLRRGLWIQGAQNAAFSYNYYVYPFDPSVNLSACNGIITASDASGNYAALPRIYELYKDGALVDTKSAASSTTFTVQSTGVYTVKIRVLTTQGRPGSSSHEYSDTENITIGSIPSVSPAVSVCYGQGALIQATGGTSYVWSNGHTASQITVTPTTTTTYNVTITSSPTCQTPKSVTVTVNPLPSAVISNPPALVCKGETKTLTASGGVSYVWSSSSTSAMFSPANSASTNITPITSGTHTYTVNVTNANGCSKSVSHTINTPAAPTIDGSGDVCTGQAAILTVSHGTSFLWSTGATTQTMSHVSGNANEIYTVTVTDANQCTHVVSKLVVRTSNPSVNLGTDRSVCPGVNSTITSNITGGTSPFEYAWSSGHSTGTINVSQTTATTYTLTVTDTKGCIGTDQVVLSMAPMPVANAGTDKTIAANTPVTLTASGSGGSPGYTYSWSNGGYNANTTVSPSATTTYTVTLTDTKGCTSTDQAIVIVVPPPIVYAADQSICQGLQGQGYIPVTASVTSGGLAPFTYQWGHGVTGATANINFPASTTTYTVTVTDALGQTGTDQVVITVTPNPIANAGIDRAICQDASVELTGTATAGTAPYSYSWSNGINNASTVVTPSQSSSTYTLTVTDSKGCTGVDQVVVTMSSPSVYAGTDRIIDAGQSATLSTSVSGGTAPFSYSWSHGATTASVSVSPSSTTTYTVGVTDANGCESNTDNVVVTVRPDPIANAGADKTICEGSSTNLTVSVVGGQSPYTYAWGHGANTTSTSVSPTTTTTYSVTVTDNTGKTSNDQVVVIVNARPNVSAGTNRAICSTESTLLQGTVTEGTAPYTYSWTGGGTSANINVTPSSTTTYTLTVTDFKGCFRSSQVIVTVNPKPGAFAGTNQTICAGTTTNLNGGASGGTAPYTYSWSHGTTTALTSVSPSSNTTYTLTVTDANGCTATSSVQITVKAKPVAEAGNAQSICLGSSANLSGSATSGTTPYAYAWSNGNSTASISVSPSTTTTYTLTVTDQQGCTHSDQVVVTVYAKPTVSIGENQTICPGASLTLTSTASAGTAPYTYAWSGGGTGTSLQVSPSSTSTYTLTLTDANLCTANAQVIIQVNPALSVNAGSGQTVCAGTSLTLNGSTSGGTSPYSYNWSNSAGSTASVNVNPNATTTYTLTVTDARGCTANNQVIITVNPVPTASAGSNQVICYLESATLTGSASGGTAPYTYAWNNFGGNTATTGVVPVATTNYTLTVTDTKGCTATSQVIVTVNPLPIVNAGADQTICPDLSANLSATLSSSGSGGVITYSWSHGASTSSITVTPSVTTTYTVSVSDRNNCSTSDQVVVNVTELNFTIDGPTTVCAGQQVTLSTTHAGTYSWSTGASTSSISHVPTTSTTYTLELTANGCTRAQSKAVQVNPLPTFTLPELTTACTGTSTTLAPQNLSPATGLTYQWMVPTGVSNPGNVASLTTNKAGQYQIKVTIDATGCNFNRVTTFRHIPRPVLYDPSLSLTCGNGGAQSLKLLMKASAAAFSPEENSPALLYLYRIKGNTSWQNSSALEVTLPSGSAQEYEVSVQYQNGLCAEDLPIKSIPVPPTPLSLPHQNNIGISPNQATDCFTSDGSINITSQLPASDFLEYALRNQQEVMIHNWQSSRAFNNLLPGTYSVGVRINPAKIGLSTCATTLGKIKFYPTTVGSTAMPSIQTLDKTHLTSCVLDNGAVEIKASFFGHALHYKVDELDWQASPIFEGLAKDGHTASVRPANGCESLVVSQAFSLNAAPLPAPLTVQNTPPAHCSQPNGSISISLPTALQSKDWLVSIDGGGTYIKNQWNWINLDRGTYHVSVAALDESCRQDYAQTISFDPPCEEICGDGIDNDFDGKVDCADEFCQASYVMGITGKSFCRDDAKVIFTNLNNVDKIRKVGGEWGTQTSFINLPAGPVAFEVRSTAGCIQLEKYNFNTPRILPAPTPDFYVNCNATHPGVLIFGNIVDYFVGYRKLGGAWTWSATEGEIILNNLEPGTYEVAASENGEGSCMTISTKTIDIFPAGAPTLQSLDQYAPNTCSTNDGRIVILAKGYHVEYAIRPQGSSQALVWSSNNQFTQLAAGAYQVFARHSNLDERFCSQFSQVLSQLVTLNTPQITIAQVTHQGPTNACVNDPTLNGSITITASKPSGSTGKLVYSIDGGTTFVSNPVFTGLGPGNYTPAVAFEDHTCKTTGTVVNMTPVQAPAITSVVTTAPTACGQQTGKITINTAAVGSWKYSIDGGATFQTSKDFLNLKTLHNYSIVVATNDLNCRNNYGTVQIPKKADCVENCSDGIDNDGNGLTDCDDPSCSSSTDCPAGVDRIVCPGSTITIGQTAPANPAYCYTWVPTTGLATPHQPSTTITPTQSGQYELIITDGNGQIVKRDKVNITVESLSPITITASAPAYCGKPLTLSAPTGYTTYSWKDASNNTLGTTASIQVNQAGAYTLTATKSAGCQTSGNITVPTLELSVATIGASTLCPGAVVELRAQTTNISGLDLAYRWSNNATTSAISAGAGAYTLTLTEVKAGCQLTAAQTLTETSMPQLIVSADKPAVCQGQTTQLRAELSAYDNIESYTWTGPAGFSATGRVVASPALNASTAGEYHLTVAFTNGCSMSKSLTLTHLVPQQATVCNNGPICPGTELKLSATYGYTYQWTGPNGFVSSEQNPVLSSGAIGVYNVTLTDSNGCVSTHTTEVNQLPGSN